MGVAPRKFDRHIKSLMHFDYPYFAEPGDGMRDEIGKLTWTNAGNAKFVGVEIPVAESVTGTPKFGYRCLQTAAMSDYIEAPVLNNYLDMKAGERYEIEFFIRKTNSAEGNIVAMLDSEDTSLFKITTNSANKIVADCASMNIAGTSSTALTLNTWTHVRFRISESYAYIYINGTMAYSGACELEVQNIAKIRVGGFIGQLDEFMIRDSVSNDNVPSRPYAGYIDTYGIGGTGKQGALNLTSGTSNLNTCYIVQNFVNASTFVVQSLKYDDNAIGIHGQMQVGDEVVIMCNQVTTANISETESGLYAFRKIKTINGTTFTLDSPITEFTINTSYSYSDAMATRQYDYNVHLIPNYTSVTIGANATVNCRTTGTGLGGLVMFRCKGNVTINGKILTSGTGMLRKDYFQMTHNHLPERFIMNKGGGVIILSEGTVTAGDNARIGASWSGAGKGGAAVTGESKTGNPGGSGYGGSGGTDGEVTSTSSAGGVGGGGGGGLMNYDTSNKLVRYNAQPVGTYNQTGGAAHSLFGTGHGGGTQGRSIAGATGGNPYRVGGGGALGNGMFGTTVINPSGANVMIICKKLAASMNAISTGGAAGKNVGNGASSGGGGTGMCYLAYEEAV